MALKVWEQLANYESFELVMREYAAVHGRTPNLRHAREIAAPFTHARSYIRSARTSELTVRPLLIYYGVVSLARGLTLFMTRGLREAALAPSHGLSANDWGRELSADNPDFAALQIKVAQSGSFRQLAHATGYRSLLKRNSSAINYTYENAPVMPGSGFRLGDALSRLPALQTHYGRWKNETRCAPLGAIEKVEDGRARIMLPKEGHLPLTRPTAESLFHGTSFTFEMETPTQINFEGPDSVQALPGLTDYVDLFIPVGDLWLTALYADATKLSKIMTLFALSYMLGILVRYYPMQWTALIRGQIDDAALPTLEAAVDLVERDFPQVVLDFLIQSGRLG